MATLRDFKVLITVAAVLICARFYFESEIPLYIGLGLLFMGILSDFLVHWFAFGWLKLGEVLGFINSRILLGVVFFIFLTPLAWIQRLRTGDKLQLKKKKEGSYFVERDHTYEPKDLEKMW